MHFVYNSAVDYAELDIIEVTYEADGSRLADRLSDLPGLVFLDSGGGFSRQTDGSAEAAGEAASEAVREAGAWDLIAALPDTIIGVSDFDDDVHHWLAAIERRLDLDGYHPPPLNAPFATGAIGFLDYDASAKLHGVDRRAPVPARAGIYPACVLQNHGQQQAWLVCEPHCTAHTRDALLSRLNVTRPYTAYREPAALAAPFEPDITPDAYRAAIARIHEYLLAGDCYQVNYAHRFSTTFIGSSWPLYAHMRNVLRGAYSAYLQLADNHAVLSFSPERFLSVMDGEITTQPIKGTAPRHDDQKKDRESAEILRASTKDLAENVMITDLLRNDLGQYCVPGSVRTTELAELYSYRNVHHLVSTVTGRLRDDVSSVSMLAGCVPGGSITGAPKRRAIEIIAELEPAPRGAYCGNVFAISAGGNLHSSIAIRTVEALEQTLFCWGGGGITVGSDADSEYQETLDKVGKLLNAIPIQ